VGRLNRITMDERAAAIEADGTVVETTWTRDRYLHFVSWDGSRFSPVQPRGQGWFEDHRPEGHGSTRWRRQRLDDILILSGPTKA
jgi:uncharacterized membrane protein